MKAFVAALSLLAAGANAEADPQFLVGAPAVHYTHPVAYPSPLLKTLAPVKVEKDAEKVEVKKVETPLVYTHPLTYTTPYHVGAPVVYKTAEKAEEAKVVTYAASPYAYNAYHTPYYQAPVVQAPVVHHQQVVYKTVEPVPKYVAKNGDIEHKVYKREAEAEAEADPQVFYNTYGYYPAGYTGYAHYPSVYSGAYAAPSVAYTAPASYAYSPYNAYPLRYV